MDTTDSSVYFFVAQDVRQGAIEAGDLQEALSKMATLAGVDPDQLVGLSYYIHDPEEAAEVLAEVGTDHHHIGPIQDVTYHNRWEVSESDVEGVEPADDVTPFTEGIEQADDM